MPRIFAVSPGPQLIRIYYSFSGMPPAYLTPSPSTGKLKNSQDLQRLDAMLMRASSNDIYGGNNFRITCAAVVTCDDGCRRGDKSDKTPTVFKGGHAQVLHLLPARRRSTGDEGARNPYIPPCKITNEMFIAWKNIAFRRQIFLALACSATGRHDPRVLVYARMSPRLARCLSRNAREADCILFSFVLPTLFIYPAFFSGGPALSPGNAKFRCNSVRQIPGQQWWLYLFRARDIRITTSRSSVPFRGTNPLCERRIIYFSYIIDGSTSRGSQGN